MAKLSAGTVSPGSYSVTPTIFYVVLGDGAGSVRLHPAMPPWSSHSKVQEAVRQQVTVVVDRQVTCRTSEAGNIGERTCLLVLEMLAASKMTDN